jgi:tRNA(Arg) A34 adenosine deaminase TadA
VIQVGDEARARGDHPFGALLAVDGLVVVEAHNRVNTDSDVTAHAETMLVRILERTGKLEQLALGVVYASCEPCPMCVGALFWAGARHVVFGLSNESLVGLSYTQSGVVRGFSITAAEISSTPSILFDGPHREDDAAASHEGFWVS